MAFHPLTEPQSLHPVLALRAGVEPATSKILRSVVLLSASPHVTESRSGAVSDFIRCLPFRSSLHN